MLISDVATRRVQGRDPRKLLLVDISKAYLHATVMRNDVASSNGAARMLWALAQGAVWDKRGSEVLGARVHRFLTWIHFTVRFLAQGQRTSARGARG